MILTVRDLEELKAKKEELCKNEGVLAARIPGFLSKAEASYLIEYGKTTLKNSSNYGYSVLDPTKVLSRRDQRQLKLSVKGLSQNVFVGNKVKLGSLMYELFCRLYYLRVACLPPHKLRMVKGDGGVSAVKHEVLGSVVLDIRQYPLDSGHLDTHVDPPSNQGLVGMVLLQRFSGAEESGLYIVREEKTHYIDSYLEPGDAYIFRPDLPHGVKNPSRSIKSNFELDESDWSLEDGRWAAFCPWTVPV